MEHKQAVAILLQMLDKHALTNEEKDAVLTAIGVLGWTTLAKSRLRALKAKRDKRIKLQ